MDNREYAALQGIGFVSIDSPDYPPLLREIYDPPRGLFFRGNLPSWDRPMVAIVGTRRPDGAALGEAYRISRDLAQGGVPVVSGLALGIDSLAHKGCLEGRGLTIAVLGSGVDEVYPASNRDLARRILSTGGCLLSEYPPGTPPLKHHFPARNRIISGLSRGVLVVEAPEVSGALITARFALEQGRDLWVGASGHASPLGEGTRNLAEDGARVISRASQILEEWHLLPGEPEGEEKSGEKSFSGRALAEGLAREMGLDRAILSP